LAGLLLRTVIGQKYFDDDGPMDIDMIIDSWAQVSAATQFDAGFSRILFGYLTM
jgi:hypothetical protein